MSISRVQAVDKSNYDSSFSLRNKILRLLWTVVYYLLFRWCWPRLLNRWRVFILKCFGARVEWNSMVYSSARIWAPWNLEMGEHATLGPNVDCYNQGKISIGDHTTISQKTYLCASSHNISDPTFRLVLCPIEIGTEVWVAADAFVGPGVKIGDGAVVAARSAVFDDIEHWTVVKGNPAKVVKKRKVENNKPLR